MLSTHVLDVSQGRPAGGIVVELFRVGTPRTHVTRGTTDVDGRVASPFGGALEAGWYELVFSVGAYFAGSGIESFYGDIPVRFRIDAGIEHYHVPLLISPWGYSTYKGT